MMEKNGELTHESAAVKKSCCGKCGCKADLDKTASFNDAFSRVVDAVDKALKNKLFDDNNNSKSQD